ncbi:hypothetical protein GCM10023223_50170 [Stackebrandtia albiflava]
MWTDEDPFRQNRSVSFTMLHLIPEEAGARPAAEAVAVAMHTVRRLLPDARNYDVWELPGLAFIDGGGNWEGVECPGCGAELDGWWDGAMDRAALPGGYFDSLTVVTPCCATGTDLHSLHYRWPVGFARFSIVTTDPECPLPLRPETVAEIEAALRLPLRQVVAHY